VTTGIVTPERQAAAAGRASFWRLVHAEWTKFRTVRGWVIAMVVAILAIAAFVFVASSSSSCHASGGGGGPGHARVPVRSWAIPPERARRSAAPNPAAAMSESSSGGGGR